MSCDSVERRERIHYDFRIVLEAKMTNEANRVDYNNEAMHDEGFPRICSRLSMPAKMPKNSGTFCRTMAYGSTKKLRKARSMHFIPAKVRPLMMKLSVPYWVA